MSTATTVVADNNLQAVFAFVAALVTVMTDHITRSESRSRASHGRGCGADKGTISSNVAGLAAAIAHRAI